MTTPITTAIDRLITDQDNRHAWLYTAGEQIREMNRREAEGDNLETEDER